MLIIVMWIAFGLVALALYFAQSMNLELRASDNRVSAQAADQVIEGAGQQRRGLLPPLEGQHGLPRLLRGGEIAAGQVVQPLAVPGRDHERAAAAVGTPPPRDEAAGPSLELVEFVDDVVDELGSRKEISYVNTLLEEGTSADRQLRVFRETGHLHAVVDHLAAETVAGVPVVEVPA